MMRRNHKLDFDVEQLRQAEGRQREEEGEDYDMCYRAGD
jgi:hypothetical protein